MFKKSREYLGIEWYEILLGFLFLFLTILFILVITPKDKPNNDNIQDLGVNDYQVLSVVTDTETDVYYITMYLEDDYIYNETAKGYYNELHQAVTFNGYNELVGLFINGQSPTNTYEIIDYEYYNADTFEYEIHYDIRTSVSSTMLTISPNGYYSNNFGNITLDITLYKPTQYNQGYNTAKEEYGIYYNNQWLTAEEYATIIENTINVQEYYDDGYYYGYGKGKDEGYSLGLKDNPNNNFGSMITSILLGVGTVLSIELLPNITIGAIIAVPIVFGIIAFVLGRKKE